MREQDPHIRELRLEERLAGTITVLYTTVTLAAETQAGMEIHQGALETGLRLIGEGVIVGGIALGYERRRRSTRKARKVYEARKKSQE